jgi:tRNA (guanine-N7-)-methyltransferase
LPDQAPETPHVAGRFFGRAKGKTLRKEQSALMQALLPRLKLPGGEGPLEITALFAEKPSEFRLEIGFGGGEHLIHRAQESPHIGFIGCEPFVNGMAKAVMEIDRLGLTNIRLHDNDALYLLRRLPPACLDVVDLLYADPWPKRRQRKRRFVNAETVALIARAVKPGGIWRFASDIDDYVGWTLMRVMASPDWNWPAMAASEWLTPYATWPGTRYEAKAFTEGRTPSYLTFVRC